MLLASFKFVNKVTLAEFVIRKLLLITLIKEDEV